MGSPSLSLQEATRRYSPPVAAHFDPQSDNVTGAIMKEKSESKDELQFEEDENPERGNWTGKLDFLLSCLGYAVGLGNVWRFPYLCFKNGGGSFLIPYFLMLAIIGIPAFLLELNLGQYSGMGPVTVYSNLSPMFKGLGFVNFVANAAIGLYYNMIIAWTIYYFFASFTSALPWQFCDNDYNDDKCFSFSGFKECEELRLNRTAENITNNIIYLNRTCIEDEKSMDIVRSNLTHWYKSTKEIEINGSKTTVPCIFTNTPYCDDSPGAELSINRLFDIPVSLRKSSSGQYLTKEVLKESLTIEPADFGSPDWKLTLCLMAAWLIIFLCLIKGIKSSGKVVYVTATFPYVVLIILLIRAVTLEGASAGIRFYLEPDFSRLSDINVWKDAAVQIFFSLSVAGGGLITLSSYNRFHNNIVRDTLIVCIGNCLTSFTAGFAIFSVLGFMATELGVEVADVAVQGTGLAFEAYPDLVTRLPAAPFWSILFFLMLFTLGLDSQFAIVETLLTGILDYKPKLIPQKTLVVGAICVLFIILGLPLCCPGGPFLLDLLDFYSASWPFLFIGLSEFLIISYIYGYSNFIEDVYEMTGVKMLLKLKWPLAVFYMGLSPLAIFIIFVFSWYNYEPLMKGDYVYPAWANGIGWIIAMMGILPVFFTAAFILIRKLMGQAGQDFMSALSETTEHTVQWRQQAIRVNNKDGEKSEFEYVQLEKDKPMIRRRKRNTVTGIDNLGIQH